MPSLGREENTFVPLKSVQTQPILFWWVLSLIMKVRSLDLHFYHQPDLEDQPHPQANLSQANQKL